MKYKKRIIVLLVFAWMFVIFNFSSKNTLKSNTDSKMFTYKMFYNGLKITNKLNFTDVNTSLKALELSNRYNVPARKCAHGTIYFVLGILIYYLARILNKNNPYIISTLFCMGYAITDEIHQLFVNGRTSSFFDVLIDTLGCILGLIIIYIIGRLRSMKYEEN